VSLTLGADQFCPSHMKLTFKTLQQQSFQLEADPTDKVSDLKAKIEKQESHPAAAQKLIVKGKILADDVVVGELGITEKDFIVLMVTKPKTTSAAPSPAVSVPTPALPTPPVPPTPPTPPSAPAPPNPPSGGFDLSSLATGAAYETAVGNLVEMGFPRDQVLAAMRAAYNNPDRAAEYLMTGIPENLQQATPAPPAAPAAPAAPNAPTPPVPQGEYVNLFQQAAQHSQTARPTAAVTPSAPALEALRQSPQFQQLRQLVQAQPHLLPTLMQQIGQSNPEIIEVSNFDGSLLAKTRNNS
jgi:UV excision repair protein RAD23